MADYLLESCGRVVSLVFANTEAASAIGERAVDAFGGAFGGAQVFCDRAARFDGDEGCSDFGGRTVGVCVDSADWRAAAGFRRGSRAWVLKHSPQVSDTAVCAILSHGCNGDEPSSASVLRAVFWCCEFNLLEGVVGDVGDAGRNCDQDQLKRVSGAQLLCLQAKTMPGFRDKRVPATHNGGAILNERAQQRLLLSAVV